MNKRALPKLPALAANAGLSWELPQAALARWNSALQAKEGDNTISIYDPIGMDPWTGEGVTAKRIAAALRTIGEQDVVVNINSPGGDVFEGIAIYNLLREHKAAVTVRVLGLAASAASVIAMAGDEIQISRAGFLMVHNVWAVAVGNRNDMRAMADVMEPFDAALADVYAARTGADKGDIAVWMDKETWFGGQQAIDEGFADVLLPADEIEEKKEGATTASAALRRVDVALAKQGMPRSERRALLNQIKGTPRAADGPTHDAGLEVRSFAERMSSIVKPI